MSLGQKNIQMTQPLGFFASSTLMLAPGMAAPTYDALGCMWRMMGLGMTAKKGLWFRFLYIAPCNADEFKRHFNIGHRVKRRSTDPIPTGEAPWNKHEPLCCNWLIDSRRPSARRPNRFRALEPLFSLGVSLHPKRKQGLFARHVESVA
jgi:hypothetical protein